VEARDLLRDAFERIREDVHRAVDGIAADQLLLRPDDGANTIAWLIWHLTRVEDDHVSEIAGRPQTWMSGGWNSRFGTDPDEDNTGYAHTPAQVAAVVPDRVDSLLAYHNAVHTATLEYLETVDGSELDRIIDRRWDPPVSVGVRLVSVINDAMQHAGQANYLRGLIERGLTSPTR
jgi:uncharacterized damage-inducible protein DinB